MSVQDHKASAVYQYFKGDALVVQNTREREIAELADDAAGQLIKFVEMKSKMIGINPIPCDDHMYNLEVAMFRTLAEANGIDISAVYAGMIF